MRRLVSLIIPPLLSASTTIVAGMAGSAMWDNYKADLPVLAKPGAPAFLLCTVTLAAALVMLSVHSWSANPPSPPDVHPAHGGWRNWIVAGGLLLPLLYWMYFRAEAPAPTVVRSTERSDKNGATPTRATVIRQSPAPTRIFETSHLAGKNGVTALAPEGDAALLQKVVDVLGTPLERKVLTPAFFKRRYIDRALAGEANLFTGEAVPAQLEKILVLKIRRTPAPQNNLPSGAMRLCAVLSVAIIDARSGNPSFRKTMTIEGIGYSEHYAELSLLEALDQALPPVKLALGRP